MIEKKTGKSLYDFAMDVLILMSLHGLSLKISLREQITHKYSEIMVYENLPKLNIEKLEF